jgi:hypothetical protein
MMEIFCFLLLKAHTQVNPKYSLTMHRRELIYKKILNFIPHLLTTWLLMGSIPAPVLHT